MKFSNEQKLINNLCNKNKNFDLLVSQLGHIKLQPRNLNYQSLLKIIINQQLSNNFAELLFSRVKNLFPNIEEIKPENILNVKPEDLRNLGISYSKVNFMRELAKEFVKSPNLLISWKNLNDNEALLEIQKFKGLGPWSANIILLFYMGRLDAFPYNDSTLKKAFLTIYGKPLSKNLKEINWAKPYRSILARYLWRWVDTGMRKLGKK